MGHDQGEAFHPPRAEPDELLRGRRRAVFDDPLEALRAGV